MGTLRLYAYSGREHGLMIVGTSDSLRALARDLEAAVVSNPPISGARPTRLITPSVTSPYKDVQDFTLSFHLEGSVPSEQVVSKIRSGPPTAVFFGIALLSVVGLFTCIRWVWSTVF